MSEKSSGHDLVSLYSQAWPRNSLGVLYIVLPVSAVVFTIAAGGPASQRAWQIYLVNYLFFSGLAAAGVVLAAIWLVSDSVWGEAIRGVALAMSSFLPAAVLLYLPLIVGRETLFPWIRHPIAQRASWLSPTFLFTRDLVSLLLFGVLCFVYLYYSFRPTLGAAREKPSAKAPPGPRFFTSNWKGLEAEQARAELILRRMAPPLLIVYAVVFSLIAWDLVMSLDARWYSTLFGAYVFMGNVYAGLAALAMLTAFLLPRSELGKMIGSDQLHQLGKLTFGLCMFQMMLFWSQYLVIWYGNLPDEIGYVIRRSEGAWGVLSWVMLLMSLLIPFCVLLSRRVKQSPLGLAAICLVILIGMWLELYILVVPTLWDKPGIPFSWLELLVTAGFFSAAMLSFYFFTRRFPIILLPRPRTAAGEQTRPAAESSHF